MILFIGAKDIKWNKPRSDEEEAFDDGEWSKQRTGDDNHLSNLDT